MSRWLSICLLAAFTLGCPPRHRRPYSGPPETGIRDILVPGNAWLHTRPNDTSPRVRIIGLDNREAADSLFHFVVVSDRGVWLEVIAASGGPDDTGPLHDHGLRLFIHTTDEARVLDPTRRTLGGGNRLVYWPDGSLAGRASDGMLSAWGAMQQRGVLRCGQVLLGGPLGIGPASERTLTVCFQDHSSW